MKRLALLAIVLMLFFGMAFPLKGSALADPPEISAGAAILMDMRTGAVLYEKNADAILEPASLTKIMTGLLVLEQLSLDQEIIIREDHPKAGNSLELKAGEALTVEELLYGMMVYSANDAAYVLAEELAGSIGNFCKMADERATELGAAHTVFKNPNGRNDVAGHVTTARDLALICREAMKNEDFRRVVGTSTYTIPGNKFSGPRKLTSTNRLLFDTTTPLIVAGKERTPKYEGILGIKTGETSTAGLCLAAAARRGDTELVAVILGAPKGFGRFRDGISLLDYGFDNYYTHKVLGRGDSPGSAPVRQAASLKSKAIAPEDCWITLPVEASATLLEQKTVWDENLEAPLDKGAVLGRVEYFLAGEKVASFGLVAANDIQKGGPWTLYGISDLLAYALMALALLLLAVMFVILRIQKKKKLAREKKRLAREAREARARAEEFENKRRRDWPY